MLDCCSVSALGKITIKQICEKADINRSTYYSYYAEPVDLFRQIVCDFFDEMDSFFEDYSNREIHCEEFLRRTLQYFQDNRQDVITMIRSDGEFFRYACLEKSGQYDVFNGRFEMEDAAYARDFYVSGSLSIIYRWLTDEMSKSIGQMVVLMTSMLRAV